LLIISDEIHTQAVSGNFSFFIYKFGDSYIFYSDTRSVEDRDLFFIAASFDLS